MNLFPNRLMFGVAPDMLIDCARQLTHSGGAFTVDEFCEALGAPVGEAEPVLQAMLAAGFVDGDTSSPHSFVPTMKLRQLAAAAITAGVPRRDAEQLLEKIIAAAKAINAAPETYPYPVVNLVVFGSYLGDKPVLGDLDIGVELGQAMRPSTAEMREAFSEALARDTSARNKTFAALRLRKPKIISLHFMEEVRRLETPFQTVFSSKRNEPTDLQSGAAVAAQGIVLPTIPACSSDSATG